MSDGRSFLEQWDDDDDDPDAYWPRYMVADRRNGTGEIWERDPGPDVVYRVAGVVDSLDRARRIVDDLDAWSYLDAIDR